MSQNRQVALDLAAFSLGALKWAIILGFGLSAITLATWSVHSAIAWTDWPAVQPINRIGVSLAFVVGLSAVLAAFATVFDLQK